VQIYQRWWKIISIIFDLWLLKYYPCQMRDFACICIFFFKKLSELIENRKVFDGRVRWNFEKFSLFSKKRCYVKKQNITWYFSHNKDIFSTKKCPFERENVWNINAIFWTIVDLWLIDRWKLFVSVEDLVEVLRHPTAHR